MKLCICFVAILAYSIALPYPLRETVAWKETKGKNVYVEPISNYSVKAPEGKIIGGSEISPNSAPYQVVIWINGRHLCSGSLISQSFVLTVAHCTSSASFAELVFGAHNIQTTETTQLRVTSTSIIVHYRYNMPFMLRNDISLIRTPTPIAINNVIQTIPLARASAGSYAGYIARLTGWGRTSDTNSSISPTLRGVNLTVITNDECIEVFGYVIRVRNICTSGLDGFGACNGDSGSPLTIDGILVGMTSFFSARGCGHGYPTGYTRISAFRDWIAENSDVSL